MSKLKPSCLMPRVKEPPLSADRNLLFGILALQMDFIGRDALIAAMHAWVLDKAKPLGQLLIEQGALRPDNRDLLDTLVTRHLEMHGNNVEKSLAVLTIQTPLQRDLQSLGDGDVQASIARVPQGVPAQANAATATGVWDGPAQPVTIAQVKSFAGLRYQVLRPHGKGGLGEVFVALDQELDREVALKEIRPEHANDAPSRGRFVREAEITGKLEHPGVVPVHGLGTYADGRPFYAMRFIQGDTLKEAIGKCQAGEGGWTLRHLLSRFVAVCNTVAFAHSRGVLHRDLKPANVMLGRYGETLIVDWGLAKPLGEQAGPGNGDSTLAPALTADLVEGLETQAGSALGTPAYMSPEQALGRLDLLGPASDLYSLGATLYEVLTDRPPVEGKATADILRKVQRGEWLPPRRVKANVPAALDGICCKAMAANPETRYRTPLELAADVERWLADEPVSVYRDPFLIRLSRWARKHRMKVAVGAALLQTAVIVLAVSVFLIARSRTEIERQRVQVERERARADAVNAFLVNDFLAQANPKNNPASANLTVRDLLDRAAEQVAASSALHANPEVEGAVRSAIGHTYYTLGLYKRAREELERAVACQNQAPDFPAAERIATKNCLCWVIYKLGNFDETMARQVLDDARAQLGPDHAETVDAADNLATIMLGNGRREAFNLYRENLATQQRVLGPEHPLTIRAALNYADGLMSNQQGDLRRNLDEALKIMLASREAAGRVFGPNDPDGFYFENALGFLYCRLGRFVEAHEVLAPLQERFLKVYGPDHVDVALFDENLALAEEGLGHFDIAEALLVKSHALRQNRVGAGHGLTRRAAAYLGRVCLEGGKIDDAVAWLRVLLSAGVVRTGRGIAAPGTAKGPPSPEVPDINRLGDALSRKADPDTSAKLLSELSATLDWLCWRSDWLRAYVKSLRFEVRCRFEGLSEDQVAQNTRDAIGVSRESLRIMEANPATPPRYLQEIRDRLQQLVDSAAKGSPAQ
jgi:serine/threonine protein kinase/tetratricopeptide (TPR) repeat protein